MSEMNYVIINSKFRNDYSDTTSNFTYRLGDPVEVTDIAVKSVTMVNAQYNIKRTSNVLIVNDGVTDFKIFVPFGQYTIDELIAFIEGRLNTQYGGVNTITIFPNSFTLVISTSIPLKFGTDLNTSPIGFMLGLGDKPNSYYPETPSISTFAPYLPNLQGANNFHIVSNTLGGSQGSLLKNNDKRPIILTVPIDKAFGEVVNYEVNEIHLNKRHFARAANIQDIDIKIIDDDNEIVDLNGTNIEIVLQIKIASSQPYAIEGTRRMGF
jgi:hypothetical protein